MITKKNALLHILQIALCVLAFSTLMFFLIQGNRANAFVYDGATYTVTDGESLRAALANSSLNNGDTLVLSGDAEGVFREVYASGQPLVIDKSIRITSDGDPVDLCLYTSANYGVNPYIIQVTAPNVTIENLAAIRIGGKTDDAVGNSVNISAFIQVESTASHFTMRGISNITAMATSTANACKKLLAIQSTSDVTLDTCTFSYAATSPVATTPITAISTSGLLIDRCTVTLPSNNGSVGIDATDATGLRILNTNILATGSLSTAISLKNTAVPSTPPVITGGVISGVSGGVITQNVGGIQFDSVSVTATGANGRGIDAPDASGFTMTNTHVTATGTGGIAVHLPYTAIPAVSPVITGGTMTGRVGGILMTNTDGASITDATVSVNGANVSACAISVTGDRKLKLLNTNATASGATVAGSGLWGSALRLINCAAPGNNPIISGGTILASGTGNFGIHATDCPDQIWAPSTVTASGSASTGINLPDGGVAVIKNAAIHIQNTSGSDSIGIDTVNTSLTLDGVSLTVNGRSSGSGLSFSGGADDHDLTITDSTVVMGTYTNQVGLALDRVGNLKIAGSVFSSSTNLDRHIVGHEVANVSITDDCSFTIAATGTIAELDTTGTGGSFIMDSTTLELNKANAVGFLLEGYKTVDFTESTISNPSGNNTVKAFTADGCSAATVANNIITLASQGGTGVEINDAATVSVHNNTISAAGSARSDQAGSTGVAINGGTAVLMTLSPLSGNTITTSGINSFGISVHADAATLADITAAGNMYTIGGGTGLFLDAGSSPNTTFTTADDVIVTGSGNSAAFARGIALANFPHARFNDSDVTIENSSSYAKGIEVTGGADAIFNDCDISAAGRYTEGIAILGVDGAEFKDCDVDITASTSSTTNYGITVKSNGSTLSKDVRIYDSGSKTTHVLVHSTADRGLGILVDGVDGISISGLRFDTNYGGGKNYQGGSLSFSDSIRNGTVVIKNAVVTDCVFTVSGIRSVGIACGGAVIGTAPDVDYSIQNVLIEKNTFHVTGQDGQSDNSTFQYNGDNERCVGSSSTRTKDYVIQDNTVTVKGLFSKGIGLGQGIRNKALRNTIHGVDGGYLGLISDGIGTDNPQESAYQDDLSEIADNVYDGSFVSGLYLSSNGNLIQNNNFHEATFTSSQISVSVCRGGRILNNDFAPALSPDLQVIQLTESSLSETSGNQFYFADEDAESILAIKGNPNPYSASSPLLNNVWPEYCLTEENNQADGQVPMETETSWHLNPDEGIYRYILRLPRTFTLHIDKRTLAGAPLAGAGFTLTIDGITYGTSSPAVTGADGKLTLSVTELCGPGTNIANTFPAPPWADSDLNIPEPPQGADTVTDYTPIFTSGATTVEAVLTETVTPDQYALNQGKTYAFTLTKSGRTGIAMAGDTQEGSPSQLTVADLSDDTITILNPKDTLHLMEVTLTGTKRARGGTLGDASFTFGVFDENNQEVAFGVNTGEVITFTPIPFDAAGTYTYTVRETSASTANWTADTSEYPVTIAVTATGDGLAAHVTYPEGGLVFTNTFTPSPVTLALTGTKAAVNNTLTAGQFTFGVFEGNTQIASGTNDADGRITFSDITYTTTGTSTYKIKETSAPTANWSVDSTEFTVTVEVSRRGDQLVATPTYPKDYGFVNTFTPSPITVKLTGTKTAVNNTLTAGQFTFGIFENGHKVATGTNDANGIITFSDIIYTATGKHTYTVKETSTGNANWSVDPTEYTVTVDITRSGDLLVARITSPKDFTFVNVYTATPCSVSLTGSKKISGGTLLDGQFSFAVLEGTQIVSTGTNTADGKILFSSIPYTRAGTHTYTIQETSPSTSIWGTDDHVFTVTVEVTQDGDLLTAKAIYPSGGIVFTNTYTAPPKLINPAGDITLRISKQLTDENHEKIGAGKKFAVRIYDAELNLVARVILTANQGNVLIRDGLLQPDKTYYFLEEDGPFTHLGYEIKDDQNVTAKVLGIHTPKVPSGKTQTISIQVNNQVSADKVKDLPQASVPLIDIPAPDITRVSVIQIPSDPSSLSPSPSSPNPSIVPASPSSSDFASNPKTDGFVAAGNFAFILLTGVLGMMAAPRRKKMKRK